MENMVVLIDTNILLDFLLHRSPYYEDAENIMQRCSDGSIQGYIAFHSVSNIFFILHRFVNETTRRTMLKKLCKVVKVTAVSHEEVEKAIDNCNFKDFEDCLQDRCAAGVNAKYIITRNIDDYAQSEIPAILPRNFIEIIG